MLSLVALFDLGSDDDVGDSPQCAKKKKFTDADYEKVNLFS